VRRDPAGNEKPDKERSTERIDAVVAAVMAVGRLQVAAGGSVYEERGLLVI
jgi:phage terminase large subunit-like protein